MNEIPKHYTVKDISSALSVAPRTIQRMIEDGKINAVKIGQQWRVPATEVHALITAKNPSNDR